MAEMEINVDKLRSDFQALKSKYAKRDATMSKVKAVREGRMSDVAPDVFPEHGAWQEPIISNTIDIAARQMSKMIAPLPTFTCMSSSMITDAEKKKANTRQQLVGAYIAHSDLGRKMYTYTDWYITYGFVPLRVELDYDNNMPIIRGLNPIGSYPKVDRFGRVVALFQRVVISKDDLMVQYPEYASALKNYKSAYGTNNVEVVFYHDKNWDLVFVNGDKSFVLDKVANPIGKVMVSIATIASANEVPRGQFDDVVHTQLARAQFALLQMKAAKESVDAPLIVGRDVMELPYGPGAVIQTDNPAGIRRLPIEIPQSALIEGQALERELQMGAGLPSTRSGDFNASIITGQGVKALEAGYETDIMSHQAMFARTLQEVIALCFEVDEKVFGSLEKTVGGSENGTPFEITYTPTKAIKGDYTVDVRYGMMAGLGPQQGLLFALQALQADLFSEDYVRSNLPVSMDIEEEKRKIYSDKVQKAALQALLGYSSSIPAMASQGQDPSPVIRAIVEAEKAIRSGKSITDALSIAFPEPEMTEPTPEEQAMAQLGGGMPGMPGAPMGGGMPGAPGAAPGGIPDIASLFAGMMGGGQQPPAPMI